VLALDGLEPRSIRTLSSTSKRGIKIKLNKKWNGSPEFEFTIGGRADSDNAKDLETRRCVSGIIDFLVDPRLGLTQSGISPNPQSGLRTY
jgi:hypothetical protein